MTTIRTEADAHSVLEQPRDWPIQRWIREADLLEIERHNERAAVLRWMALGAVVVAGGIAVVVYWLTHA